MKRNGFVFVETIIAVVILTSSLLLLYSTFSKILQSEKTRVYYDDISYIYRSWYVKNSINELNVMSVIRDLNSSQAKQFITIGIEYEGLFNGNNKKNYFSNLLEAFDVNQMILLKENKLDNLKKCTQECSLDSNCENHENCYSLYTNLSEEMISYLRTIYVDVPCTYILAIEYKTCNVDDTNCKNYYSWVSV